MLGSEEKGKNVVNTDQKNLNTFVWPVKRLTVRNVSADHLDGEIKVT